MASSVTVCQSLTRGSCCWLQRTPTSSWTFSQSTKRVHNNIIYNEYISNKEHVHMNSTQWETLTDFTKWLGREGYCKVDETPKGWYIQYVDRDPETIRKQEEAEKKRKADLDDEERSAKFIEEQVRRGREGKEPEEEPVYTELVRESEEEKVAFNLSKGACSASAGPSKGPSLAANALRASSSASSSSSAKRKDAPHSSSDSRDKKKKSALDEIIEMEEQKKKKMAPVKLDYWLHTGIVVKIVTKRLGEKYYKKKGVIKEVQDKYTAFVKMVDTGDKLKLDQTHLETVIPAPGKRVLIVNGHHRGMEAVLEGIDEKNFSASLTLESGHNKGKRVEGIPYEDFSKMA
ncbi:DNA/RNA-binding protein KIN17 isoform X2 [Engraulis encrasicolus]|uniref:DNA/RNA-binding protein KIN17 isoform X2 n=1 Tax=Engraulis encrasicolus TaxID=184585 RepID=UPI002FD6277D